MKSHLVTAVAPSNIAFIKYWGRLDERLRLPTNASISMNLSSLATTTTVQFDSSLPEDRIKIAGLEGDIKTSQRISLHLDRIRSIAGISLRAYVDSKNSFPSGTGLSSSASGYAALTCAAARAAGLRLSTRQMSILARKGSGSACRSIPDGFVEWRKGATDSSSYAVSLHAEDYWELHDVVAVISTQRKDVSSTEGQQLVKSSPFFKERLRGMPQKIAECKDALEQRLFSKLGTLAEEEALNMHAVMMTSTPSLLYLTAQTVELIKEIWRLRKEGIEAYFTLNTGQDVHILCEEKTVRCIIEKLKTLPYIRAIIDNKPARGAHIVRNE